jgi:cytochrome c peroxidase
LISAALGAAFLAPAHAVANEPAPVWQQIFARPAPAASLASRTPADPALQARINLGKALFIDKRLSGAGNRSCATCHDPARSFTDGLPRARGLDGKPLLRNTPALWNLAETPLLYWDGRAAGLAAQARFPILHPNEMAGDFKAIVRRLSASERTRARFSRAFPGQPDISEDNILAALAAYEATLVSPRTRFDAWIAGDRGALSAAEARGFSLFVGRAGCVRCHTGWRFTDDKFHDIGLAGDDPGRGAISGGVPGLKAFKTPGLREVAHTAPYMHDGSKPTLDRVLDHYAGSFIDRPGLAANMVRDLRLDNAERSDLIAFLNTLSSGMAKPTRK